MYFFMDEDADLVDEERGRWDHLLCDKIII